MAKKIRRFICFRSNKKKPELPYGVICNGKPGDSPSSNVVPSARMVVRGPIEEGLTLQYITKNLVVLTSPDEGTERAYGESLKTATLTLKSKHAGHYKVWSVSRPRNDVSRCLDAEQCGWPQGIAPPLDRLCAICKGIEKWTTANSQNVAVLHCKGDRSRAAMVISAYMHYNAICSGDDSIEDRFCMQRFSERYIGANGQPSHKRYINYFASLLSGKIRVNPAPIYLHRIVLTHTVGRMLAFKVYERLEPVYQSCALTSKDAIKLDIEGEVRLRGDIIVKCFIISDDQQRKLLFVCQINTCTLEAVVKPLTLTFHKEELDLVFADPSFDNRSVFELHVSSEPAKNGTIRRKSLQETRVNSYGEFNEPEDSSVPVAEYSEIRKKPQTSAASIPSAVSTLVATSTGEGQEERNRDVEEQRIDRGDRQETVKENGKAETTKKKPHAALPKMPPPPVPPKPRSASALDDPMTGHQEARGVLPAHLRPLTHRPPSPKEAALGRGTPTSTPNIEPDLVGKDRYDKASKCFSYVPAKALKETFENPRPPRRSSLTRQIERREQYVDDVRPEEIRRIPILASDLQRREQTPTWEDEIENAKQAALLEELARIPTRSQSVAAQPYYMRNDYTDDRAEKPLVFDQAQRATATTPTSTLQRTGSGKLKTRYGSYRQLNDEQYSEIPPRICSDMDDLCDPEYYLNYTNGSKTAPRAPPRQQHMGAKSVEFPRKHYQPAEAFTDPLDDILASTINHDRNDRQVPAYRTPNSVLNNGPVPPASSYSDLRDPRDAYRNRNCRSVAAVSHTNDRTHTVPGEHRNEVVDAADDWLSQKLKKAKSSRGVDHDLARRRTQEKVLLEELKQKEDHSNEYADPRSGPMDPLAEFKREEERLKNTHSPFDDSPRRARQVRGKPPTPPPRERSRSPARSDRLTPNVDNYRSMNGGTTATNEDFDFSTLNSIVQPNQYDRSESRGASSSHLRRGQSFGSSDRPPFQYNDSTYRSETPTRFISGQERVAAAIYRAETPQRDMYASGTIDRAQTPGRYFPENSVILQRSETPAFPVSRETPLPFHPLLYNNQAQTPVQSNGTNGNGVGSSERTQTLNYRSSSPRSQYGQFSRRSSLTSVDPTEIIHHHPVFVKDTSKYWYKPTISREQAINMLRDKPPGTFVVRDSNSFPGAFGLALKVAQPPPGVAPGDGTELVRHFLIEPSPKGVKLKGCNNEPVFGSLSALVYQHSITPLALPAKLLLPDFDPAATPEHISAAQALLEQGAACNVSYIGSVDVESLTGAECIKRAISYTIEEAVAGEFKPVSVHFKVSSQGVTLTDNTRKAFFRRHFPVNSVIYAGMDPVERRFDNSLVLGFHEGCVSTARMFGFVARKPSSVENACHVFAEFEPEQPASAVVNFINKVMLSNRRQ